MTEEERKNALAEIRDRLDELAALQMASARDVTRMRRHIEALTNNLRANWDELEEVRAEIERRLLTAQ